eukprot:scaffold44698_cov34-Tisochrysis_lutea.AAC.1
MSKQHRKKSAHGKRRTAPKCTKCRTYDGVSIFVAQLQQRRERGRLWVQSHTCTVGCRPSGGRRAPSNAATAFACSPEDASPRIAELPPHSKSSRARVASPCISQPRMRDTRAVGVARLSSSPRPTTQ